MTSIDKKYIYFFILVVTALFFLRTAAFSSRFGGIEHDSGWYLGVARNLAQRGIYASYTNTIKKEGIGASPSLHGRFSVQDEDGYSYFPAGVTAGPGYVVFEAIMMRLFGHGWWQYRLWPLLSYVGLLLVVFLIVYRLGGALALVIIQIWFWLTPQLTMQFSYEAYGEHIALFYLLLSFYLVFLAQKERKNKFFYSLSGFFFSLSLLTKYLFFIAGAGFLALAIWQIVKNPRRLKIFRLWAAWVIFLLIPILAFELYRYLFLVSNFGIQSWEVINKDFLLHFKSSGSGLSLAGIDWEFVKLKATFWEEVGIAPIFGWCLALISPFFFPKTKKKDKTALFVLLVVAFLATVIWFIFVATFGWIRHVWHGLVVGMMLVSVVLGNLWKNRRLRMILFVLALMAFVNPSLLFKKEELEPRLILDQRVVDTWYASRNERGLQGLPANPIMSLRDQKELQEFFDNQVDGKDKVYYLGWFLVAEASPLVDKVFYTIDRYLNIGQQNPAGGESYLILGPYQKGKLSIIGTSYHDKKVSQLCKFVVFSNPSYTLCTLRTGLVYENSAYD